MTGWLIYSIITTIAVLVFIGIPLAVSPNVYKDRHIRK